MTDLTDRIPALVVSGFLGSGKTALVRHLLEAAGTRILIDAGLFQGLKKLRLLNWKRPEFDPAGIDHLILTHTHIDHSGYIPRLVREGFRGPIHCTRATFDLAKILLLDSAHIQAAVTAHGDD